MTRALAVLIVGIGVGGIVQSPSAQQATPTKTSSLVGTWTLASDERQAQAGAEWSRIQNPRGLLVYDGVGHALEIVTRAGRAPYAANQPTPAEARATFESYGGFWGGYRIDEQRKQIAYHVEGAVNPNVMGQDLVRSYELQNNRLTVGSVPGATGDGGRRWVWERVPPVENLSPTYRQAVGFWQHVVEQRVNLATGAVISENRRAPSVIVYTPAGYVGVHFVPLNRKRFAADEPTGEEARAALAGYVGYYGALTVYPGMVFHHRLAMLGPSQGDTLKRFVEFAEPEIHIKFPPGQIQGQESTTHVTLKRLSGEADMLGNR